MIAINDQLKPADIAGRLDELWRLSGAKIRRLDQRWNAGSGAPVFTVDGRYTSRGWTEWTQGFQFGSSLLQFDATGDDEFLQMGRDRTRAFMPAHVTHFGVHDHGFNIVSTYGNLRRLMAEGRTPMDPWEMAYYDMALAASGSVQARRWTALEPEDGFVYSFNGPHSLFVDTMRNLRVMALAHLLGHRMLGEHDEEISLLDRVIRHARTTAKYIVYFGQGRDIWDERGRTAHEAIFNTNDGRFRCPNTQQGYSPYSTWTRGQSWAILGAAELLELFDRLDEKAFAGTTPREGVIAMLEKCAFATCDHYIEHSAADGVCYWDTGAPGLQQMPGYKDRPADPFNAYEPVDSSAAAITAQGLIRFGNYLTGKGQNAAGMHYRHAGLTMLARLLEPPYLSEDESHEGLLLHAVYHRPNGWDHVPAGSRIPNGESCMWGDYHLREAALLMQREIDGKPPYCFFNGFL